MTPMAVTGILTPIMQLSAAEQVIAASLVGKPPEWPSPEPAGFSERLLEVSEIQSTHALIYHQLKKRDAFHTWPTAVIGILKQEAQRLAAIELIRSQELANVLNLLASQNINPLIFKGAALAYSHYASPSLRTRNDTDLLISDHDLALTHQLLLQHGYVHPNAISGEVISYESMYRKVDKFSVSHVLDVHTRVNNAQCFAYAMNFQELAAQALPIAALGASARGLPPVYALLLACMHRAAHMRYVAYYNGNTPYPEGNLLIWLLDIHLLAESLNSAEWNHFTQLATSKKLCTICLDALRVSESCFRTVLPENIISSLFPSGVKEASSVYLSGSAFRIAAAEFMAVPGSRLKWRFIRENIFPPADYIRQKYRDSNGWLPLLYLRRALGGVFKRLKT